MSARECIGLVFLIAGMAIVPLGWIVSHKIFLRDRFLVSVARFFTLRACESEKSS